VAWRTSFWKALTAANARLPCCKATAAFGRHALPIPPFGEIDRAGSRRIACSASRIFAAEFEGSSEKNQKFTVVC
jgi:hypothetical protein